MELTKAECIRSGDYGVNCSGEMLRVKRIVLICAEEDLTAGGMYLPFKKKYVDMCVAHYTLEGLCRKELPSESPENGEAMNSAGLEI